MNYHIEVLITNIQVDSKYFSFDYRIKLDGEITKDANHSDSHSRSADIEVFKKELHDNYALQLAIEHMF